MSIIIFILILGIVVLIHEFGHFIAAKKNGVLVEEFGFGFPPRLGGIKIGETLYSINLFPIGGFVKLFGEEYAQINQSVINTKKLNRSFVHKKPWQKIVIISAGVVGNFILGWFLISYVFTQGVPALTNQIIVETVMPKSPAAEAGIKEKDIIKEAVFNQKKYPLNSINDLVVLSKKSAGKEITLTVARNKKVVIIKLIPRQKPPAGEGPLGLVLTSLVEKKYPWYQAPFYGLKEAAHITWQIISQLNQTLVQLITFKKPSADVVGPIGIASYTSQVMKFGKNALLEFIALISLNLAIINILPFPALDGGRVAFVIYEMITKKRVNANIERNLNLIGFSILMSLALIVSINDILKLINSH
jgi:regulator of sigma E protease